MTLHDDVPIGGEMHPRPRKRVRKPLVSKTRLKPGKALRRRKRLNPVSARKRRALPAYEAAREVVKERAGGRCEAGLAPSCLGRGSHAHHRVLRSQGGPDTAENLLWVCPPCHGAIHDNPARSLELGLLKHRWST